MPSTDAVVETMGGSKVLGRRARTASEVIGGVREGLPYGAMEAVMQGFALDRGEMARLLRIPARTLDRRKGARRLSADESDRLYRLARVLAHARETFGSAARATAWLRRPNRGLGGDVPLALLDTDAGTREVEDVLVRIDHGVHG